MPYCELLKKAIDKSGYSNKEISIKCKELGKSVDPSYISKLVNGKIDPPSDEITQTLSEVLQIESEKLIIEAYLDKAPNSIVEFIKNVRLLLKAPSDELSNYNDNSKILEIIEQTINSKPLSDFVLEFNMNNTGNIKEIISNNDSITIPNIKYSSGIIIEDDSMQPLIPKESEILFSSFNRYEDGDIIGVYDIDTEKILIRKYYKLPNYINESDDFFENEYDKGEFFILVPINKNYSSSIYHTFLINDVITGIANNKLVIDNKLLDNIKANCVISETPQGISIIGKVEKIITKL